MPDDAQVEITAKKVYHGYNAGDAYKDIDENEGKLWGREYNYDKKVFEESNVVIEE